MRQQPFGQTFKVRLSFSGAWFSLGPGWAAAAGLLATGGLSLSPATWLQLVGLWVLVDPLLGTLWDVAVNQEVWRRATQAKLPAPPSRGFSLPYAQPGSLAGRLVLRLRRYQRWWQDSYWPAYSSELMTFGLGLLMALLIALLLGGWLVGLTLLAVGLMLKAGAAPPDLTGSSGGRWQALVQGLLPWLMGLILGGGPTLLTGAIAICYSLVYLGLLRTLGEHPRATWLFWGGQLAAGLLLLGLRLLPVAVVLAGLLIGQRLLKNHFPAAWLSKVQPYLLSGLLLTAWAVGYLL
ncbi:MAG TPA: hypothetical protein PKE64_14105 [Anaerolineae bacterium]|nr:hypothetical protein [Anaerolineae bacterium]